uniref:2-hydroxyacyl-CoA lyase 2 n=1 Tax=Fundulus heteroclitus TaxID=8078 RepID=A0A3Q2QTH3_FUNHE
MESFGCVSNILGCSAGFALAGLVFTAYKLGLIYQLLHKTETQSPRHGGESVAEVLRAHGVKFLFTLVGGHISPILVACEKVGIRVVDTRHEATAVFAADAVARLSTVGVAAVTAGPGLTNTVTAVKNAQMAESPLLLLGGAAGTLLQVQRCIELVSRAKKPVILLGSQATLPPTPAEDIKALEDLGIPCFLGGMSRGMLGKDSPIHIRQNRRDALKDADLVLLATVCDFRLSYGRVLNRRSKIIAVNRDKSQLLKNSDMFWKPTIAIQQGRGALQDIDQLSLFRPLCKFCASIRTVREIVPTLRKALAVAQSGTPVFIEFPIDTLYPYHLVSKEFAVKNPPKGLMGKIVYLNNHLMNLFAGAWETRDVSPLPVHVPQATDDQAKANEKTEHHLNPLKVLHCVDELMAEDSIIVADGGDFVGSAAYIMRPRGPLRWLDPGAFGTLGVGGGFALGAKLCRPESEVWIVYGDGSLGYSVAEYDTFTRHKTPVISVVGNDACWSQISREQVPILGSNVACGLAFTYHTVADGYGGKGYLVGRENEDQLRDIIQQAQRDAREGKATLLNVLIGKTNFREGSISV